MARRPLPTCTCAASRSRPASPTPSPECTSPSTSMLARQAVRLPRCARRAVRDAGPADLARPPDAGHRRRRHGDRAQPRHRLNAPTAEARCVVTDAAGMVIYVGEITYPGDCVRLNIELIGGGRG